VAAAWEEVYSEQEEEQQLGEAAAQGRTAVYVDSGAAAKAVPAAATATALLLPKQPRWHAPAAAEGASGGYAVWAPGQQQQSLQQLLQEALLRVLLTAMLLQLGVASAVVGMVQRLLLQAAAVQQAAQLLLPGLLLLQQQPVRLSLAPVSSFAKRVALSGSSGGERLWPDSFSAILSMTYRSLALAFDSAAVHALPGTPCTLWHPEPSKESRHMLC
jgi:hypothetical protein